MLPKCSKSALRPKVRGSVSAILRYYAGFTSVKTTTNKLLCDLDEARLRQSRQSPMIEEFARVARVGRESHMMVQLRSQVRMLNNLISVLIRGEPFYSIPLWITTKRHIEVWAIVSA